MFPAGLGGGCFNLIFNVKAKAAFVVRAVGRIISGPSVGRIIIILSLRVGKSKNKNIVH